jgi:hypothetical protein
VRWSGRNGSRGRGLGVNDTMVFYLFYTGRVNGMEELPMMHAPDGEVLRQRIDQLHLEHRDLDDVIARLSQNAVQDQLQLQRLKKRKLHLKDQISQLERQLTPDISA